jgi:DNA-binding GntR family transcriptional regulator
MKRPALKGRSGEALIDRLRDMIVSGELPAGSKLHEIQLAERLGVSRTPLREALRGLESERLLASARNRGFWVAALNPQEVRDLYPIVWSLERLAVIDSWSILRAQIDELRKQNELFRKNAKNSERATLYDAQFHTELTRHTTNVTLRAMIESLKTRLKRYEALYMKDRSLVAVSSDEHEQIIAAISSGDQSAALAALERNWSFGMDALLSALSQPNCVSLWRQEHY